MGVRILAVGDICGEPGLDFLAKRLKDYRKENEIDFVVANGENANVVGVTPRQADLIFRAGVDVITLGNHTWVRTELRPYLDERSKILRPANYGPQCPGRGIAAIHAPFGDVCVLNLLGRFTLDNNTDNPFVIADGYMAEIRERRSSWWIFTPRAPAKSGPWAFCWTGRPARSGAPTPTSRPRTPAFCPWAPATSPIWA